MSGGFFVTGTDTGVGKTLVSSALLRRFTELGVRTAGMKPVAAGTVNGRNEDVEALGNCVYLLDPPIAPHIAAKEAGMRMELDPIVAAFRALAAEAQVVVVEGVGGFRVPLNEREDTADLARRLGLPVILVVGMRLGCLNHALLTRDAIAAAGLRLAGWVANRIDAGMARADENVAALSERLRAPLIADVPFGPPSAFPIALERIWRAPGSP